MSHLYLHLSASPSLSLTYSLALSSALWLWLPFEFPSSPRFKLVFTHLFEEQDWHHLFLLPLPYVVYPSITILFHSLRLPSVPPYFLLLSSPHPTLYISLPLPSITPLIASSSLHLSIDNPPVLCPLQPSQSDPVRGLMLWKMTVNRHFYCHRHCFGAACRLQPCCLATPQTAPLQKARALLCLLCRDRDPSLISIISHFVLSFCCSWHKFARSHNYVKSTDAECVSILNKQNDLQQVWLFGELLFE